MGLQLLWHTRCSNRIHRVLVVFYHSVTVTDVYHNPTIMKVAIFPASGALGTSTYTHLLKMVEPADVILIARHPEKISPEHIKTGVIIRQATWESSTEHLSDALSGAECLFLISYPSLAHQLRSRVSELTRSTDSGL